MVCCSMLCLLASVRRHSAGGRDRQRQDRGAGGCGVCCGSSRQAFSLPVIQIVYETLRDAGAKHQPRGRHPTHHHTGLTGAGAPSSSGAVRMSATDRDPLFGAQGACEWIRIEPSLQLWTRTGCCASAGTRRGGRGRAPRPAPSKAGMRRITHGSHRSAGQHYFEATVTDEGLCRVGWSASTATRELGGRAAIGACVTDACRRGQAELWIRWHRQEVVRQAV